jgi:predicted polyphosphate/ATP-dependent NAD kinase
MKKKLGLVVNPIAGMGGKVALKGSDGKETLRKAVELGAIPTSPKRTVEALNRLTIIKDDIELVTYPYDMGEEEAKKSGFNPMVIGSISRGETTSLDTRRAAKEMAALKIDLLLFAGGDGTARDIYDAVENTIPVLGIPSGVKIHSAVYAINPLAAGELAVKHLKNFASLLCEAEVMDVDEKVLREEDRVSSKLYGYLRIPCERRMTQSPKEASSIGEQEAAIMQAIAERIIKNMEEDCLYIIGPGTTTRAIMERLGLEKTLLGVDVVERKKLVANDVNEARLMRILDGKKARIIVTPIGGQGYIFGRGNQQISPEVIRRVGSDNIIVIATPSKIYSLMLKPLLVDTGDEDVDQRLRGYRKVVTGYGEETVCKVS